MSLHTMGQLGAALLLAATLAGCSSSRPEEPSRSSDCSWWRSSCMYEGQYEPDEREYAEEEAARLNRQQSRRMGRD
ncbi:hypothetical protein [Bordetella genomosp. 13]|uniref:hypothetical protein n=1 Tax=Bordetella genomosp. 13 TaxID=463040 RepID=UPI0011AA1117|nr:hypothetical protein [Bordetella genomosp. 13]